ncbi:response regulator [Neptunomonas japonica]|uniref:Two-component system response regulator n=1 Tax=Neptunomonas japonica JAMM 1380 TaxID=1441457 RepID=A0A7R6PPU0_9GAMM|nr:response regulator [Neptunomonas japonica]BBB30402.1 two-component system response regulator [Neptunomonas japonica JAMM 1380]
MKTLTTGEIAKFCDVNLRTAIRWIERGALKGYKLPGRGNNRVKEEDFIAFLKEHGMPVPIEFQRQDSRKVLIVDDELPIAKAIQRILVRAGYETSIAIDGFRAGSKLLTDMPALMTLDLSMPGLDGYDVLAYVRSTKEISNIKIIVISALDDQSLKKALICGADAVLSKPFDNEQLLTTIEGLLGVE